MLDIAIFTSIRNALFFILISNIWNCFFPQSLTNIMCWKTCEVCPIWYVRNDIIVQFLAWRTPFSISAHDVSSQFLFVWECLKFPFNSEEWFHRYLIFVWQSFFFFWVFGICHLMTSGLHDFLLKISYLSCLGYFYLMSCISLAALKILFFSSLILKCLGVDLFEFILLGIYSAV